MKAKEFYFIRHGQTDHHNNDDHISLNSVGFDQATRAKDLTDKLRIACVYYSPLKRAIQTKNILFSKADVKQIEVNDLSECTTEIWHSLTSDNNDSNTNYNFISRAVRGMCMAVSEPTIAIVVAHGGIHYAFCKHHNIKEHPWVIGNCVLVHFKYNKEAWHANIITG